MVLIILYLASLIYLSKSQQDLTLTEVPVFKVGTFYPTRPSLNADETEEIVCKSITNHINRNSPRFRSELVFNSNTDIKFQTADSHLMSSRMQFKLDALKVLYSKNTITILKAWTAFPDPQLSRNTSLHYEGRSVSIQLPQGSDYNVFLRQAVEAGFDWVYYETSNRARLSVLPSNCARKVDLVFLLDRSGSVGSANHALGLQFMSSIVSFFTIGLDNTRVGLVPYSSSASIQFDLDTYSSLPSLQEAISRVPYKGGSTNTPSALFVARYLLDPNRRRGARELSKGIPKIAVLITDGKSNRGDLQKAVSAIKADSVKVYAVGIGNISKRELQFIASDPDDDHVFILKNYSDAENFAHFLGTRTCDTATIVNTGENTTIEVSNGRTEYFQTNCDTFSTHVLVELIDVLGTSFIYASATITNPSPLTTNTVSNTTTGITRRIVIVNIGSLKLVYIAVEGQTNSDSFTLTVWDLLFDPDEVYISIVEGPVGSTVYDVGQNMINKSQSFAYTIIEGNSNGIFSINKDSGKIITSNQGVNFTKQQTHNLTVQAQNTASNCQKARIRINIQVTRNYVEFNSIPTLSISEAAPVGTVVVQVRATGGSGHLNYDIIAGDQDNSFVIHSNTGDIVLAKSLNYEMLPIHNLTIRAISTGSFISADKNINIQVQDINEEPYFITPFPTNSSKYSYSVIENMSPSSIGIIRAGDPDLSTTLNGTLVYTLSTDSLPFSVSSNGTLYSTMVLDRESRSDYVFELVVSDNCHLCYLSIAATIKIAVTDVNDNAPMFTFITNYTEVSEDLQLHTEIAEFIASDADIGSNAIIEFILIPNTAPFNLSSSGILSLTGPIDYEANQYYSINITASNPGTNLIATTTSTIKILNVNDNTPVISGEPYVVTVAENSMIGTLVTTVTATDGDLGIHGEIVYTLISGNFGGYFDLNSTTGTLIIKNSIDREMVASFSLVVRARDKGIPLTRQDLTTVEIIVSDVNDNPPIFMPSTYSIQLREDLPVGHHVIQEVAIDADQPNTQNSNITYSIIRGNTGNAFFILSDGQVQISQRLNFKTNPFYTLVVQGRDGGSPAMSSTATVIITVIDVNENPLNLTGGQAVNISESAPAGSIVGVFSSLSLNQTNATLNITAGNTEGKFTIDEVSGLIKLSASLDFETTTSYLLALTTYGQVTLTSSIIVNVTDENEFYPVFYGTFAFETNESNPSNTTIGYVSAADRDRNDEVTYKIIDQNLGIHLFYLNSKSGRITTIEILDREALSQIFIPPTSQLTLKVAARDNGSPVHVSVRDYVITLVDINDNSPTFTDSMYFNQLQENLPAGQTVFSVSATDNDLGTNAEITYSFVLTYNQRASSLFQIDSITGAITTTMPLDREFQPYYLFSIIATDSGFPPKSSTVTGNLTLIDQNDNDPQFPLAVIYISIKEGLSPGIIGTFTATDKDRGLNGELEYTIHSQNTGVVFEIDRHTGILSNMNSFDFESSSQETVTITATDQGLPHHSSSATVIINVTNVDEQKPVFQSTSCDATVSENAIIGTIVSTCSATDLDTIGGKYLLLYSLTSTLFEVDSLNGTITTKAALDHEMLSEVRLALTATDSSGLFSTRSVLIVIEDVNDNAPLFQNTPYMYHFTSTDFQNYKQEFLVVHAVDLDEGGNETVSYVTGNIYMATDKQTFIEVIAQDTATNPHNSSINVTVTFQSSCLLQKYAITSADGRLSAYLLCAVTVSPASSLSLTLGQSQSITCHIVRNSPTEYLWLHNGTIMTNSAQLMQNASHGTLNLNRTTFIHSGDYVCKAYSSAGGLQSTSIVASVQVSPVLITTPSNSATHLGGFSVFKCEAFGSPIPKIQWLRGTQVIGEGNVLNITNIKVHDASTYVCVASNIAGNAASHSARLVTFDNYNIVQIELGNVTTPSRNGSCQHFDPSHLIGLIESTTSLHATMTELSGSNLCELTPCYPSPCRHGGTCIEREDVVGHYKCVLCGQGFSGVNCSEDINECDQDVCGINGVCSNTEGSFNCTCNQGYTGRTCQYLAVCTINPCSGPNEVCVESQIRQQGYQCIDLRNKTSLVVTVHSDTNLGQLDDLIQNFMDKKLSVASQTFKSSCEPRFVFTGEGKAALLWVCPENESKPTAEDQFQLCQYLLEQKMSITDCVPPHGEVMIAPTPPPLLAASVAMNIVVLDDSYTPIDALVSAKTLEKFKDYASKMGIIVLGIAPKELGPRPVDETSGTNIVLVICTVVSVTVVLVCCLLLCCICVIGPSKSKKRKRRVKPLQTIAIQMEREEERQPTVMMCAASPDHKKTIFLAGESVCPLDDCKARHVVERVTDL